VPEEAGHDWLGELAAAVADGRALDWDATESRARNADERASIRGLRAVAAISLAHSELTLSDASESLSVRSLLQVVEDTSTPATWGSLQILDRVGRGRFGDVYRAWDPNLAREVALKLLRHRDIGSTSVDREVTEEGRLMARVRHENVVTVYGAQRIDGRTGLWMEFVEGRTLEAELKERGPFTASEVAKAGIELCRALTAVHDAGLIHRDVKTQNVLRNKSGRLLLGDFGTGRDVIEERETPGQLAGTPSYLAPEVFAGSHASVQSDVYSLGVLLFRLATGTYPVATGSVSEIRAAHATHQRRSLNAIRREFPKQLTARIERAIEPNPSHRYRTAAEMETALAAVVSDLSIAGSGSRWKRLVAPVSLSVLLAFTAYFAGVWTDRNPPGPARLRAIPENALNTSPKTGTAAESKIETALVTPTEVRSELRVDDASAKLNAADVPTQRIPARVFRQVAERGVVNAAVPSPDGRLVAFTGRDGALALLDVSSGKQWKVVERDPRGETLPARFSQDGSRITYLIVQRTMGVVKTLRPEIRSVPVKGGDSRLIWQASGPELVRLFHSAGGDETLLAGRRSPAGFELMLISATTGQVRKTRTVPIEVTAASLSPDARFVAYNFVDPASGKGDIDLWGVESNTILPLVHDESSERSPLWTSDGKYLLFISTRSGGAGLWGQRVEAGGALGLPVQLDPHAGEGSLLGLTKTGTLFFLRTTGGGDVYLSDLDPATLHLTGELRRASRRTGWTSDPTWSPDSQRLAFVRHEDDSSSIVIRSNDGTETELLQGSNNVGQLRWELGGDSILFHRAANGVRSINRLDISSGRYVTVLESREHPFDMYDILRHSGMAVLWRRTRGDSSLVGVDLETGTEKVFQQRDAGPNMLESHRGDRVAYTSIGEKGTSIRVLDLKETERARDVILLSRTAAIASPLAWSIDDRELIVSRYVSPTGALTNSASIFKTTMTLWALNVSSGEMRPMSPPLGPIGPSAIRPDGRQFAISAGFGGSELWMLKNATASLPR